MFPDPSSRGPLPDRESHEREVASLRPYLLKIANGFSASPLPGGESPSDCVHHAIASALADIRAGKCRAEDIAALKAWMRTILFHKLVDAATARQPTPVPDLGVDVPDSGETPSEDLKGREERAIIRRALEMLPARDRQVLFWRHAEDLTFKEIGRRLGISVPGASKAYDSAALRLGAAYVKLTGVPLSHNGDGPL